MKLILILLLLSGLYIAGNNYLKSDIKSTSDNKTETTETSKLVCTRTTRLDNEPQYDRALSLLYQKLENWNPNNDPSLDYFPQASIINCIKVIEGDVKKETGAEGFFEIDSENIKHDYFPVFVDKSYSYADDLINALILLHEITHVQQYIDSVNNNADISCIDQEVEAFYASWKLIGILHSEEWKSITYRLDNDKDLHPQLQIVQTIKDKTLENFETDRQMCFYGSGKDDPSCIDNNRKKEIKEILVQDEYYQKQCGI